MISGTARNKYINTIPPKEILDSLGLRIKYDDSLLPEFNGMTFRLTNGKEILAPMRSIVLKKVR